MLLFLKHRAYFYPLLLRFQIYKILVIFFRNQNSFQSNILDFQIIALRRVIRGKRFQKKFFFNAFTSQDKAKRQFKVLRKACS